MNAPNTTSSTSWRLRLDEGAADRTDRELLVHRIGLDVLLVVGDHLRRELQAGESLRHASRRQGAGRLERGEVPQGCGAEPPVQPEQRHRVVELQDLDRHVVDVRVRVRAQPRGLEPEREQVRVEPVGVAAAVLVVLQLHQRGLGRRGEPRHDPRGRVGLLEVIDRAMPQELEHLLAIGLALDERGDRRPVVVGDEGEQRLRERPVERRCGLACPELGLEVALERAAQVEDVRVPLQLVVDVLEPGVVQLVHRPQRDLDVVASVGRTLGQAADVTGSRHARRRTGPRSARRVP